MLPHLSVTFQLMMVSPVSNGVLVWVMGYGPVTTPLSIFFNV